MAGTVSERRVRMVLAYDGTAFCGWQMQRRERTVQGTVAAALARIQGVRAEGSGGVHGAGRTDARVHAAGQVAHADVRTRLDDARLLDALRDVLPEDVRPLRLETVGNRFHAQYDAVAKTYLYLVDRSPEGDPFLARFSAREPRRLDVERMRQVCAELTGTRDWSGFAASKCVVEDRVRTVTDAECRQDGTLLRFRFRADGFLTHMVRNMVGTLLDVAAGVLDAEVVGEMMARKDRGLGGRTAPGRGLCLWSVEYSSGPSRSGDGGRWPFGGSDVAPRALGGRLGAKEGRWEE